jgi:hypothetical protein
MRAEKDVLRGSQAGDAVGGLYPQNSQEHFRAKRIVNDTSTTFWVRRC